MGKVNMPSTDGPVTHSDIGQHLQTAIWPEAGVSTQVEPYFTLSGTAGVSLKRGGIDFAIGGTACVDTYFNMFNLGKWRRFCGDIPFGLRLVGKGQFHLTVFMVNHEQFLQRRGTGEFADRIFSEVVTLDDNFQLPLMTANAESRCLVFFQIKALSDGRLDDFAWTTSEQPRQLPELVLSVTTFKRELEVASTIKRFQNFRANSPVRDHIRMFVVDNGNSVEAESGEGLTLFPNKNLGGAGGFTRGLLEAKDDNATHCLFMDDDASMHMESITRTWMMLAYTLDSRLAIAGAMLDASHTWKIWENGATFDRGCKPMYHFWNMRNFDEMFNMEFETTAPAPDDFYGGWWYFAFPIEHVKHFAFPFFVRGDDVSFSLANDFKILTLSGVTSIQESFVDKESPTTWYLDMRSHLAHHLSLPDKSVGRFGLQRMFLNFYLRTVLRYHYDSLSAVNLAIEDVLRGPQFFADHADMAQQRQVIKTMTKTEVWTPNDNPPRARPGRAKRSLRALLLLTLNGHLLPFSNRLGSSLIMSAALRSDFRQVYGAKQITYVNANNTATYTVRRDRRRFFSESIRFISNNFKFLRQYHELEKQWQESYSTLTSDVFWREKLG